MTAACTGMTSERNTSASRIADRISTIAMNSGSLLDSTWLKSIAEAVAPPIRIVAPVDCSKAREHPVAKVVDQAGGRGRLGRGARIGVKHRGRPGRADLCRGDRRDVAAGAQGAGDGGDGRGVVGVGESHDHRQRAVVPGTEALGDQVIGLSAGEVVGVVAGIAGAGTQRQRR